jgi:hypothetical protein
VLPEQPCKHLLICVCTFGWKIVVVLNFSLIGNKNFNGQDSNYLIFNLISPKRQ